MLVDAAVAARARRAAQGTASAAGLEQVAVSVPDDLATAPFDQPRNALVPKGWTISVWQRLPKPRLMAWAPDGDLLVSVPSTGQVIRMQPTGAGPLTGVLLGGLDQPHGLAFAGSTLYIAQSDQIDAYDYADGKATNSRVIVAGLPDAKSPDLGGAYSHALKSVAVGPDGAVYFSIGSTGNISAQDRTATPPRATIMRVPPGGGPAEAFATGVRNGTGLAVAPDGAVWTAVNNRDNVAVPDAGPDYGKCGARLRRRSPARVAGEADPGSRVGLALLQSRRWTRRPATDPRRRDERRRS